MKSFFEHIPGNEQVKQYLVNMVQKQAIGNSLLFAGPTDACKDRFALALAKLLMGESAYNKIENETHPDLHIYRPEGKIGMHSIASMRQFCEEVYLPPYESPWKVFIIHDAERMLTYSANALLKTFEEPALDSLIILLSSNPHALLSTILSRCRTIRFQPLSSNREEDKKNPVRLEVLNFLAKGKVGTYTELSSQASRFAELIEEIQKAESEDLKEELQKAPIEQFNAHQKSVLEKELEGAAMMSMNQHAKQLLGTILSWTRDLHLIDAGGRMELLENPDFHAQLLQTHKRGEVHSLEFVEKKVKEALTSLERSTSLNLCLETLFLSISLI